MSNSFSRSLARAQPTPKVCKSKHITPGAPPPWNPTIAQIAIAIADPLVIPPVSGSGTATAPRTANPNEWSTDTTIAGIGPINIRLQGDPTTNELLIEVTTLPENPTFAQWTGTGTDWIQNQPYDSGTITLQNVTFSTDSGTAHVII